MIQQTVAIVTNSEQLAPLYVVQGSELYLQSFVREAFFKKLAIQENDLNFAQYDMEQETVDKLLDEAETLPFFGEQRLLFVEAPFFLTAEKRTSAPDHQLERLLAYLDNPVPSTVMVFFAPYDKLDERKKLTKKLKKQAVYLDVKPPSEQEIKQFIRHRLKEQEMTMDDKSLQYFLHVTEMNLSQAMTELDKLMLYAHQTKRIELATIEQLIPKTLENNIFELTEAILKGDAEHALVGYRELVLQGEETIKINAILIGQIRLYIQVMLLMRQGMQQGPIAEYLKIHPYRVKLAMQQAKKYSQNEVVALFDQLVENDYRMKTGQIAKDYLFELFILETAQKLVGRKQ